MPVFFVSHARSDTDTYLERLVADLTNEVRRKLGRRTEEDIRFWDSQEIELGERWPERLSDALRKAKLCVCLLSPAYFNSEFCGREFEVFRNRSNSCITNNPQAGIFPIWWETPHGSFPKSLENYQYMHGDLPELYGREGIRYLMKLSRHQDEYQIFIDRLASKLVAAAESSPLPEIDELGPLLDIPNAFSDGSQEITVRESGPGNVQFVFLAATASEMRQIRADVSQYENQGGWYWKPYLDMSAGKLAQLTATEFDFRYDELAVDPRLIERLREAEKRNEIVILLVDPWTIRIPRFANLIRQYDNQTLINCSLLVPWNDEDPETVNDLNLLNQTLANAFPRKLVLKPPAHEWDSIRSSGSLRMKIGETLEKVRMLILQLGTVGRKADNSLISERAQLSGLTVSDKPSLVTPVREAP